MNAATTSTPNAASGIEPAAGREHEVPAKPREEMIAELACHIAEKRGFAPGYELRDWFKAERIFQKQFPEV